MGINTLALLVPPLGVLARSYTLFLYWKRGPAWAHSSAQRTINYVRLVLVTLLNGMLVLFLLEEHLFLLFHQVAIVVCGIGITSGLYLAIILLQFSDKLNRWLGKTWVKALDFPYILFGFLGLLRLIDTSTHVPEPTVQLTNLAIAFVGVRS